MSEKITDMLMLNEYNKVFGHYYHTENNKQLFNKYIPDGWDIIENILFIIEDKRLQKYKNKGKQQLLQYYNNLTEEIQKKYKIYLILGYGISNTEFKYIIYKYDNELINTKLTLQDLFTDINLKNVSINMNKVKEINNYIYDNINIPKSQKTLFIASILICLKIDNKFVKHNKGCNISDKMLETIQNYYNDNKFTDMFASIRRSIDNIHYQRLFDTLQCNIKEYGKDILNIFYSEFCKWDKNGDANNGVVLTPDDIVELMVDNLKINDNDTVLDFCTGTGSFLMKSSKYSKYLYGCENNIERYSLAKCNFILNDLDYSNLKYSSCFEINYKSNTFDKVIINPPFSCDNNDEHNKHNLLNWKSFKEEQKFVIYGIELLKENGIGCFIIPCRNFRSSKQNIKFKETILNNCEILKIISLNNKVFVPNASVECSILVVKKKSKDETKTLIKEETKEEQQVNIIDYSNDGYEILKKVRIFKNKPEPIEQIRNLNKSNNWNYENDESLNINMTKYIAEYNNNYNYYMNNRKIIKNKFNITFKEYINIDDIDTFAYTISELLEEIKGIKTRTARSKQNNGIYPLISSSSVNNGVIKYIDTYDYDTKNEYVLSIANSGSSGYCFVHKGKFSRTGHVNIYRIKQDINPHLLSIIITNTLTKRFNYNHGAIYERIKDIIIKCEK